MYANESASVIPSVYASVSLNVYAAAQASVSLASTMIVYLRCRDDRAFARRGEITGEL